MHGINTLKELNEAATASHEKAAWPAPTAVVADGSEASPAEVEKLPDTPAISRVEQ